MASAFLLSREARDTASALVEELRASGVTRTPCWLFNRALAAACALLVLVTLFSIRGQQCDAADGMTKLIAFSAALAAIALQWLADGAWRQPCPAGAGGKALKAASELAVDATAFCFASLVHEVLWYWNALPGKLDFGVFYDVLGPNEPTHGILPILYFTGCFVVAAGLRVLLVRALARESGPVGQHGKVQPA